MSLRFMLSLVVIILFCGCTAQNDGSSTAPTSFVFDAGAVFVPPSGATIEHTFTFVNPSASASMSLAVLRNSCSCVSAVADNPTVPPGATGRVTLSPSVGPMSGQGRWESRYSTGTAEAPEISFTLTAKCYARVSIEPGAFPVYELLPGQTIRIPVSIASRQPAEEPPSDPSVSITGEHCSLSFGPLREQLHGSVRVREIDCELTCRAPEAFTDAGDGEIAAQLSASQGADYTVTRSLHVRSQRSITLSPSVVWVRSGDATHARRVTLRAANAFAIVKVATNMDGVQLLAPLGIRACVHELECTLPHKDVGQPPRTITGHITVATDHPLHKEVRIPVFVVGLPRRG